MKKKQMRFKNHPNRQRHLHPRNKSKFWCSRCDADLVGEVGKCRVCGLVNNKKKSGYKRKLKGY